ncbi:polyisoprenoid-binding protein [Melaminivora suipulveris]|uniref:Polyisoprenoid-binding protein n=1 Tax=Melaminivora suipulveris TaxID=2109913 RepID=A0A2R3Q927_9BURK|nr:YceI family protein [Melaminivora suipulveris]AVO48283.1 polyisoprenoid-binding protein [Melaminivora suipulveris]
MSLRSTLALTSAVAALACAPLAQAEPTMYTTDPDHTFATFEISHFGASIIRGRFDKVQGSVQLDRKARTGRVDVVVDVNSLSVGVPSFEKHVRGNEILDAGQHPTARFVGTQFTFDGDKVTAVAGELTLKGKTQPVTFKANQFSCYDSPILKTEVCGGDFEATIDRTAFGVDYMVSMGFTKQVRIVAQIEAAKR